MAEPIKGFLSSYFPIGKDHTDSDALGMECACGKLTIDPNIYLDLGRYEMFCSFDEKEVYQKLHSDISVDERYDILQIEMERCDAKCIDAYKRGLKEDQTAYEKQLHQQQIDLPKKAVEHILDGHPIAIVKDFVEIHETGQKVREVYNKQNPYYNNVPEGGFPEAAGTVKPENNVVPEGGFKSIDERVDGGSNQSSSNCSVM